MSDVTNSIGFGLREGNELLDLDGSRARARTNQAINDLNNQGDRSFLDGSGNLREGVGLTGRDFFGRSQLQNLADFNQTSPIARRLLDQQNFQNTQARNRLNASGQSALRQTLNQVASRGGLDSGARTRLAAANQRNLLNARQGLQSQQINSRNQILSDDANRAVSTLGQLAGFDRADQQSDQQLKISELNAQRQADILRQQAIAQLRDQNSRNFLGK